MKDNAKATQVPRLTVGVGTLTRLGLALLGCDQSNSFYIFQSFHAIVRYKEMQFVHSSSFFIVHP